jgi:hypothetical protein
MSLAACILFMPATNLAARPSHPAGLVSPKQVVLSQSDVTHVFGRGFTRTSAGPLPRQNAAAAAAILRSNAYTKLLQDWVSGYAAEYSNLGQTATSVKSSVNLYKTAGLAQQVAQATFASRVALTKHAGGGMFQSSLTRYSGVGEYAELTTNVMKSARGAKASLIPGSHQIMLSFTRGHYGVSVLVDSSATIHLSAVLAAARLMDNRLRGG